MPERKENSTIAIPCVKFVCQVVIAALIWLTVWTETVLRAMHLDDITARALQVLTVLLVAAIVLSGWIH
jgi:hypothetical protein